MICFTVLIAKIGPDILELILFICSFHVKCVSKCSPRNFTDSSLLFLPTWLMMSLFNLILLFTLLLVFTGLKMPKKIFLTFRDHLFAHNQS